MQTRHKTQALVKQDSVQACRFSSATASPRELAIKITLKCQGSIMRYINHWLYNFLFLPAILHLSLTLSKPPVSDKLLMAKQEALIPNHAAEGLLLCSSFAPQCHNPLLSVTLRAVLLQRDQQQCHSTSDNGTEVLLCVKKALWEEASSESAALGTAKNRRGRSGASQWHCHGFTHPTCTCAWRGKVDSAKNKCLRGGLMVKGRT